ncbi:PhoH family protein [Hyphobacterium sp. Y6023]|uniref:PhoH-like protein n=1 Tax=Hyphobacterium marinum TaxID=3116574 RepID=A0ABU7LVC7_9PROT|nr:PhoH family protein [Hyphobacterium sp. Y6023]MEE2565441.1 PhoH family protein [Hyphobacterium sp. Y6023]
MTTPRKKPAKARSAKPKRAAIETLHFDDASRLRALAGEGDRNLILIESELGVGLSAPGAGQIQIEGDDPATRAEARRVINRLYSRLGDGLMCDESDVRSAILMAESGEAEGESGLIRVPRGASFQARTPRQGEYVRALKNERDTDLIFGVGPAGTGKTLLAVAYGASQLVLRRIERLIITRPAVEAGEKLGFLPGDLAEKVDPYLLPVWDALSDALGKTQMEKMREEGRVEVAPLAFMRGRTLNRAFIIVDEAQNATRAQMRMVLTRLGQGSRMVVTGDPTQTDLDRRQPSGLPEALGILKDDPRVAITRFERGDVVRHDLVARIVEAYEQADSQAERS